MRTVFRLFAWLLLAGVIASALLVVASAAWLAPFQHATISINGDQFTLGQLHDGMAGADWLVATGGVLVAMLVVLCIVLFVVPVAVLVPLVVVALAMGIGVFALAGVAALLLSPVLLLVWLAWLLLRSKPPRRRAAGATIVG